MSKDVILVKATAKLRKMFEGMTLDDFKCTCPGSMAPHKPFAGECLFVRPPPGEPIEFNPYLKIDPGWQSV